MRREPSPPSYRRLLPAVVVSLLVHLPLVWLGAIAMLREVEASGDPTYFEVAPIQRAEEEDPRDPSEERRREDEEYEPPEDLPDGQVVEAEAAGESRPPLDPSFLGSRDQVVMEQLQARNRARGEPAPDLPPPVPFTQGASQPNLPEPPRERLLAGLMVQDQGLRPSDQGEHTPDQAPPPISPSPVNLQPSLAAMTDAVGGSGLDDLGDLDEGDRNLLSTARFLHAPFFQRVKRQVEQYWHPDVAFRQHDPGGHIYGYRDRETVVRVVLDERGTLVRAYLLRASGAAFLDDEALGAIEQAAPFPNPPRGLVDEQTRQIVFTFGFRVELGEQPIFRLRRYQ